jgi:hypothetical protein
VCGGATGGNFSPLVAACGTVVTDLPISPWDSRDSRGERCQSGERPAPLPHATPHQVTGDVAETPRHRYLFGTDVITTTIKAILEPPCIR